MTDQQIRELMKSSPQTAHRLIFAERSFKLYCHNVEDLKSIRIENNSDPKQRTRMNLNLYNNKEIAAGQREKLAEFFNNYKYEPVACDELIYISANDDSSMEYGDIPSFIYCSDNEAWLFGFFNYRSSAKECGILEYLHFRYDEINGELIVNADNVQTEQYRIDYNFFKESLNNILGCTPAEPEEETAKGSDNVPFINLDPSFLDLYWKFSDDNAQQSIETTPEQRENIFFTITNIKWSSVSKESFETHDIMLPTPKEHIELISRDAESLYFLSFSLINDKTYAVMSKYDTVKSDYTDEVYLISDDTDIIQRIKDCMNK